MRTYSKPLYDAAKKAYMANGKTSLPVLDCFYLHPAGESRVALATTNLDESKLEYAECAWNGPMFGTCVPMKPFRDWLAIAAADNDPLEFTYYPHGAFLCIQAGNTRAEFKCIPADEWPEIPAPKPPVDKWLAKALSKDHDFRPRLCESWGNFCTDGLRAHIDPRLEPQDPEIPEWSSDDTFYRDELENNLRIARDLQAVALLDVKKLTKAVKLARGANKAEIRLSFNGRLDCYGLELDYDDQEINRLNASILPGDGYEYSGPDRVIAVHPKYILDALSGLAGSVVVGVPFVPEYDENDPKPIECPIYLSDGIREALVMPMYLEGV